MNAGLECLVEYSNAIGRKEEDSAVVFQHAEENYSMSAHLIPVVQQPSPETVQAPLAIDTSPLTGDKFVPLEAINGTLLEENFGLIEE